MRISGAGLGQGIEGGSPSKAPAKASVEPDSAHYQTSDLLAISAAAVSAISNGERLDQLKVQVDSGEYHQPALGIAQRLLSGALNRTAYSF